MLGTECVGANVHHISVQHLAPVFFEVRDAQTGLSSQTMGASSFWVCIRSSGCRCGQSLDAVDTIAECDDLAPSLLLGLQKPVLERFWWLQHLSRLGPEELPLAFSLPFQHLDHSDNSTRILILMKWLASLLVCLPCVRDFCSE